MHASDEFSLLGSTDLATLLAWLSDRYGLAAPVFADHRFWQRRGAKSIWIAAENFTPPPNFRCETLGILVMRKMPPAGKLTSTFLLRFGRSATRNTVELEEGQLAPFLSREPVFVGDSRQGYQIVWAGGRLLGAGYVRSGYLRSELPKAWPVNLVLRPGLDAKESCDSL